MIGTALGIGMAAISAGGSIASGAIAASGARAQASAAERASAQAVAEQRRQFDITQQNLAPWLQTGTQALQMLQYLLGLGVPPSQAAQVTSQVTGVPTGALNERLQQLQDVSGRFRGDGMAPFSERSFEPSDISGVSGAPAAATVPGGVAPGDFGSLMRDFSAKDFEADPGYAFRIAEGAKALERSAASRGTVLSGGTLKELARYNQGFASNEFQNAFNRFQSNRATRFNQLASIAGLGQTTATDLGRFGAENARSIGDIIIGGQTAAAAARASGYNAWANAIQNAAGVPLNWMLLSRMGSGSTTGGSV